jgi:hypothetical protein
MIRTILPVFLIFFVIRSFGTVGTSVESPVINEFTELKVRKGLPNFFEKVLLNDTVKVAYLGGSITAQPGWRVFSFNWFRELYPKTVFTEINAAIGGTASDFGAFRLQKQVMSLNPDLVFVEFAVNDSHRPEEKIIRSVESIVRKIWEQNPGIDICLVYTLKEDFLKVESSGELPSSIVAMEKVAERYGIPSVNFGFEVSRMVAKNELVFTAKEKEKNGIPVFSPDGVHPYPETGHQIYFGAMKRSFEKLNEMDSPGFQKHVLPQPLHPNCFSNPQLVDITSARLSTGWEYIQTGTNPLFSGFSGHLEKLGKAKPGETLSFRFKGKAVGIYDIMGPDAGKITFEIDGVVKDTIYRFDEYCTYRRMNYLLFDNLEDKEHRVVFKVLSDPVDKAAILSKRGNVMNNPDDYRENNWYVGKLLVDGIILP